MPDAKVEIQISAKDSASSVFKKVGVSAADLGKTLAVGIAAGGAAIAPPERRGQGRLRLRSECPRSKRSRAPPGEMAQLSSLALKLGKDTSFSASEAASGLEELSRVA
jgi:hypothetical protein